jgi:predicted regulator of Ras-like GTPase activity (Roadblock/LC7/MglB family)
MMNRTPQSTVRSTHAQPMPRGREDPAWPETQRMVRGRADDLLSPKTQLVADRDDYLGQGRHDVGRRVGEDQVELFVAGDVAHSLQQEFSLHQPEFIALHDVGTSASLRLLSSLAAAAGSRVQRLSIRRQGHGVALAALQFVEALLKDGSAVRVYSTDVSVDAAQRTQLAKVLLAHSKLGVLLVGDLPPNALAGQLGPLHESVRRGPWPNRDLLMLPLGSSIALATPAAQLGADTPVQVHVTPHAARPKDAWAFIGGSWNRLHGRPGGERSLSTDLNAALPRPVLPAPQAPTEPMPLDPLPAAPAAPAATAPSTPGRPAARPALPETRPMPMPVPGGTSWAAYVERCAAIKGVVACCVFDTHSLQVMASVGSSPSAERLAHHGAAMLAAMGEATRGLGMGPTRTEAAVSTTSHHLVLRPVPGHPGVAVHLVLQAATSNLTLARMQLERIEAPG